MLRVDEKNIREYSVFNVCGVIITTNHKTDGIYLPADDRRHFVAWSDATRDDFDDGYWTSLYHWYAHGGNEIVAHYLAELDLTDFDPKAPPPKTEAFWEIVDAGHAPENAELLTVLEERLGSPEAVTIATIKAHTTDADAARMAQRPQEPQADPAPARGLRLRPRPQPRQQAGTVDASTASSRPSTPEATCRCENEWPPRGGSKT